MKNYVILNDGSLTVVRSSSIAPKNTIGTLPETTPFEDFAYVTANQLENETWVVYVDQSAKSANEAQNEQQKQNDAEIEFRFKRNNLLAESDWTQLPDSPLSAGDKIAWATYRQKLRDLPSTTTNYFNVNWPETP